MPHITLPAQGWRPRDYQLPFWNYMAKRQASPTLGGARAVLAWHRRAGKDLTCINWCAVASMQRVGLYWLVFPLLNQGRRIAWMGIDGGGNPFIRAWPESLVERRIDGEMRLHLKNGSVIQIMGADEPDRAVGANPVGIIFSEYSLCNPAIWHLTNPILAENGGWAVFNGTPRGENHFYDLLREAQDNRSWFASHLSVLDTQAISPEALRNARAEMKDEALFQQEFMCSFTSPVQGAYYDTQMRWLAKNGRITDVSVDPSLEVHTAWDLGLNDANAIWFFQVHGREVRVVDYHESSGESLVSYIRYVKQWVIDNNAVPGENYAPHDIAVREYSSGKSRIETARELGFVFKPVQKHNIPDGIEAVRKQLPMCWFDKERCHNGLNALKCYHKEWDATKRVFRNRPEHDWASHGADAFRTLAWGLNIIPDGVRKLQMQPAYATDYGVFDV